MRVVYGDAESYACEKVIPTIVLGLCVAHIVGGDNGNVEIKREGPQLLGGVEVVGTQEICHLDVQARAINIKQVVHPSASICKPLGTYKRTEVAFRSARQTNKTLAMTPEIDKMDWVLDVVLCQQLAKVGVSMPILG
jgi:hypothetical protein